MCIRDRELGLSNTKYYVDDGYTGTNFNRPAFQELLDDIEMGYISVAVSYTHLDVYKRQYLYRAVRWKPENGMVSTWI